MPAKYVRPYSKGQKSDFNDAEAIAEAVQRPTMKFVAKTRLRADEDRRCRRRPIRFGVNAVRYSFIVMDLHHLLLAGLSAHSGFPRKRTPDGRHASKVQRRDIRPGASLHFKTNGNTNCAGRRLAVRGDIASKISGGEAIEAFPLSRRVVLDFFRVRCSASRSGDPIVAGKRPNYYAINYAELQAWIEIAHRPLIQVNDAARR